MLCCARQLDSVSIKSDGELVLVGAVFFFFPEESAIGFEMGESVAGKCYDEKHAGDCDTEANDQKQSRAVVLARFDSVLQAASRTCAEHDHARRSEQGGVGGMMLVHQWSH